MPDRQTDRQTTEYSATQLVYSIKHKLSHTIVITIRIITNSQLQSRPRSSPSPSATYHRSIITCNTQALALEWPEMRQLWWLANISKGDENWWESCCSSVVAHLFYHNQHISKKRHEIQVDCQVEVLVVASSGFGVFSMGELVQVVFSLAMVNVHLHHRDPWSPSPPWSLSWSSL